FGPGALPDVIHSQTADFSKQARPTEGDIQASTADGSPRQSDSELDVVRAKAMSGASSARPMEASSEKGTASVTLGRIHGADTSVFWSVNIAGNPHLMIAGLPGMGKTTCLVNLCRQLQTSGITPIVFSYHDDIDSKLAEFFLDIGKSDCQSLGFNPMRVTDPGPLGHIESAGLLRDIFASIFPELGDLQLETIRAAIKSSYQTCGWGLQRGAESLRPPPFRAFFEKLQSSGKSDSRTQTLMARLTELDDYQFFNDAQARQSFLDETRPALLQ